MKFAKELERDAVPEWRIKYLNYKAGKKYVKAAGRAFNRASATPRSFVNRTPSNFDGSASQSNQLNSTNSNGIHEVQGAQPATNKAHDKTVHGAQPIPLSHRREDEALTAAHNDAQYGSFVPTPPLRSPLDDRKDSEEFELPDPAIPSPKEHNKISPPKTLPFSRVKPSNEVRRSSSLAAIPTVSNNVNPLALAAKKSNIRGSPSPLKRLFSHSPTLTRDGLRNGARELQSYGLVSEREKEFINFLDSELEKVETFYRLKEQQAGQRIQALKSQLHEMRNRRLEELAKLRRQGHAEEGETVQHDDQHSSHSWIRPIKAKIFAPGPNSRALQKMPRTPLMSGQTDRRRDYTRRPDDIEVSYRSAKRKLKLALQEFYRGLELLKSYALLNRVAFRKLNKKFDKAINARPPYRYMNDKVDKSWFVNSTVVDGHITTIEDLYARYFERGNHKLAAGKLRSLSRKPKDESGSSFLGGLLLGTGAVFAIQGVVNGAILLFDEDPTIRTQTSYLMQLYGGYFLGVTIFTLFCLNCLIWTRNKVNYPFIFEFDMGHHLDWRTLLEFPAFFFFLSGVFMWANFGRYGSDELYIYFPVMLIGITLLIIFIPLPIFAHKSRQWFAYSHLRLLLAGLYPVEFRDFFLGDIYCSLTYATSNIELFFCLYGHEWQNPAQCNSTHSRAMGFLAALPPIWRLLQCIRRYKDTRNIFPHLVNGGKYTMTIMAAVTLSMYRIHNSPTHLAMFIAFSVINSVYCSIWDLFMDFSLLQSSSRHRFLRDILALKSRWPYYFIMIVDPILRFAWVFYAIFTHDAQHSTIVSFLVALLEVVRRGMWALFRVENEHCANVSQYKASRDVPLPYRIEPLMGRLSSESSSAMSSSIIMGYDGSVPATSTNVDPESLNTTSGNSTGLSSGEAGASTGLFRRHKSARLGGLAKAFSRILAEAHKQDFVKRKKEGTHEEPSGNGPDSDGEDDDDDSPSEEDETSAREREHEHSNYVEIREAEELRMRGSS